MTIRSILQYPDPRLKIPAVAVERVDADVKSIVSDMFETHYAQENCAALAASQLDWGQDESSPALRITVIDFSENKDSFVFNKSNCKKQVDILFRGLYVCGPGFGWVKRAERINVGIWMKTASSRH